MTETFIVRLLEFGSSFSGRTGVEWQLYDGRGRNLARSQGSLPLYEAGGAPPPAGDEGRSLVVLLPGHSVFAGAAAVAKQSSRHLRTALAFAVEEQLAEAAEAVHVAYGASLGASPSGISYPVAVVRDAWMGALAQALEAEGLAPDLVTSEALLIPHEEGKATLLFDQANVLFRLSQAVASRLEADTFALFFESYLAKETPQTVDLWTTGHDQTLQGPLIEKIRALCQEKSIAFQLRPLEDDAFSWLCQRYVAMEEAPISLLQDSYQKKGPGFALSVPHKKAVAAIVALCAALQLGMTAAAGMYYRAQADALFAQSAAKYKEWFPQDSGDAKARLEQVKRAAGIDDAGALGFLSVLARNAAGMRIEKITYDGARGELTVEATADDAEVFERLKQASDAGFAVEPGAVAKEGQGVHGQVLIRRRS